MAGGPLKGEEKLKEQLLELMMNLSYMSNGLKNQLPTRALLIVLLRCLVLKREFDLNPLPIHTKYSPLFFSYIKESSLNFLLTP